MKRKKEQKGQKKTNEIWMFSTCAELSFPPKNSESNFFQDPLLANFDPRKNTTWIMLHFIHSEKYSKS
jgi:hypothetical protein